MKRAVIGCIVALGLVIGGGAGAAFAGETNGHGGDVPGAEKASSARAAESLRGSASSPVGFGSLSIGGRVAAASVDFGIPKDYTDFGTPKPCRRVSLPPRDVTRMRVTG